MIHWLRYQTSEINVADVNLSLGSLLKIKTSLSVKIAFIETIPMSPGLNQREVCYVYIYRALSLIYCAQLVFAKLACCSDHAC